MKPAWLAKLSPTWRARMVRLGFNFHPAFRGTGGRVTHVAKDCRSDPVLQDVPVLLLTSLSRTNIKVRALDLGADDYIVKPFDRAELVARVRRALRRSARYRELSGTLQGVPSAMSST